jgi:hypothetical protein
VTVDVLAMRDGPFELGLASLPSGEYGDMHFDITSAKVVKHGQEFKAALPARVGRIEAGFTLESDTQTDITIELDTRRSLRVDRYGRWMMLPVLEIVEESTERG